ncbi:cbb3-type cytochrome oxidase subunit 3 [Agarilytica rhodophyticola]|uniref:cbb3-type cytochrome oxidase subunit 3 n=1 Tax=Agarilytica rhodophyticola TaxID=1737490 RepID=UPI000B346ECA|nr:cbb3-type cytochrome c oxidase subunit 3 [Agarilytica rhodophyticola]
MDINTLRGMSVILVMIAFAGICWWAFSPKHRKKFNEAAQLPFADESAEDENTKSNIHCQQDDDARAN